MEVTNIKELFDKKNKVKCAICNESHMSEKCARGDLVFRIQNLVRANAMIPQLMGSNKEAVEMAQGLQGILKKADEAHTILMQILSTHGDVGDQIKNEYMGKLETWANPIIDLGTTEQLELFSQEP